MKIFPDTQAGRMASVLASALAASDPTQTQMLTWSSLARMANVLPGDATLHLTSDEWSLLEARAFLEDEGGEHEIGPEELKEAYRTGLVIHPESGEEIPVADCILSPFFTLPGNQ